MCKDKGLVTVAVPARTHPALRLPWHRVDAPRIPLPPRLPLKRTASLKLCSPQARRCRRGKNCTTHSRFLILTHQWGLNHFPWEERRTSYRENPEIDYARRNFLMEGVRVLFLYVTVLANLSVWHVLSVPENRSSFASKCRLSMFSIVFFFSSNLFSITYHPFHKSYYRWLSSCWSEISDQSKEILRTFMKYNLSILLDDYFSVRTNTLTVYKWTLPSLWCIQIYEIPDEYKRK